MLQAQTLWEALLKYFYCTKALLFTCCFLKDKFDLQGLAQQYQITAMPTLILIKDHQKVSQIVGANLAALTTEIDKHSKTPAAAVA